MNADEIERLAWDVTEFMRDVDPYGFRDDFDSMEEAVDETRALLAGRMGIGRETIAGTLRGLIDDGVLMPEDEARAEELLNMVLALDGRASPNRRPGRRRMGSKGRKPARTKARVPQGYSAIFVRSNGDISFTHVFDIDTLRFGVIPSILKQEPGAKLQRIVTEDEKNAMLDEMRARGVRFK